MTNNCDNINKYGVNMTFFNVRLKAIGRDLRDYKAKELGRALARLAFAADEEAAINQMNTLAENNHDTLRNT